jgi:hypothetical protein
VFNGEVAEADGASMGNDVERRWRTLQLVAPVFQLLERAAPRAELDHERYDLGQLALRAIDFVVSHQASIEGSVSPGRVVDHLTDLARRMSPDDPARPWTKVAKLTFATLLNDGRPHRAHWVELATDETEWAERRPFTFRLLRLADAEDGTAVSATDEAVLLYLQALDTNLADRAMALKLIVERQMVAGEFDRARATAVDARRTAEGLAASLRDKLDDTKRDVRSVDWTGEMPQWLSGTLDQLGDQLDMDRNLLSLAEKAGENPAAATDCRAIVGEVRRAQDVWLRLERRLQAAIPTFLAAQQAQRFSPRGSSAVIDLGEEILAPVLAGPVGLVEQVGTELFGAVGGVALPGLWSVDSLVPQLLRAPVSWERPAPAFDSVGDLVDIDDANLPAELAGAVRSVLASTAYETVRLSALLKAARSRQDPPPRLVETVWSACLWIWVSDNAADEDAQPADAGLSQLLAVLAAADDGTPLTDEQFGGPDLLIGAAREPVRPVVLVAAEAQE